MLNSDSLHGSQDNAVRTQIELPGGMSLGGSNMSFPAGSDMPASIGKIGKWTLPLVALGISCIATLVTLYPTVSSLVAVWRTSSTFSYGFLILPICAVLVWERRRGLVYVQPTNSWAGLTFFALATLVWLMGNVSDVQLVQHFALIGMLDALVWTFLGTAAVRVLSFPLLFVYFAVPVGESLIAPLQRWTAAFTVAALRISGIPAFQDGLALYTPSGSWQVAEACSGIRYLIASMVIGVLVAGIAYRTWPRRIAFLIFSAVLPVGANALRAYGIVALAHFSGNTIAVGADHIIYGFVFFSVITIVLLVVGIRGYEPAQEKSAVSNPVTSSNSVPNTTLIVCMSSVILLLVTVRGLANYLWSRTPPPVTALSYAAPPGWGPSAVFDREWAPEPSTLQTRKIESFALGSKRVSTALGWYSNSRRGVELINPSNIVGKSGVWTVLSSSTRQVIIHGIPTIIAMHTIAHGPERRVVWIWYSVDQKQLSDGSQLRLIQARNRLSGHPVNVAFTAVSAPYNSQPSEAAAVIEEFLQ